jgi:hypothetical protein
MPFSSFCPNKGCGIQEPYIDPQTDKVYCSKCDNEINNITYFAKQQMKTIKQFRQKNTNSFSVKCDKCGKVERPKLVKGTVVCGICDKILESISEPFRIMLQDKLKTVNKDV